MVANGVRLGLMTEHTEPTETPTPDARPLARTDPKRMKERRPYKIRGPETWALIRESYLAGASAKQLARRYDVTEWAIWRRAWKQGWTKTDRVEPRPPEALSPSPLLGEQSGGDPAALKRRALLGVEHAMAAGRLDEAADLARLAASLSRLESGQGGGLEPREATYTLEDVGRALLDSEYAGELMWRNPGDPPHPVKDEFWRMRKVQEQHESGVAVAFGMWMNFTGGKPAQLTREGYGEAEAEQRAHAERWLRENGYWSVPPETGTG